jgi:anti-anti-sigma factor
VAYRFRERGGLVAAGRFPFLRCVALAAGKPAQARSFYSDRRLRVSFARLRRMASASSAGQLSSPGAGHRLRDLRGPSSAGGAGTNAMFPVTAVIASTEARPMNASAYLAIITELDGQRSMLRLQGELDVSNRERLRRAISSALERHPPILVVDLSGLSFTDCAGVSVLVWAHKRLAGQGRGLVITGTRPIVRRLLRLTDLDTYLHLSSPETLNDDPDESAYI